jgi:hypothetical protein
MTGIAITQSAITQDALKQAQGAVDAAYQELREQVRHAPVTYTDDTGGTLCRRRRDQYS